MKKRLTLEIDCKELFDFLVKGRKSGNNLQATLGERLVELCLEPDNVDWKNAVGLGIYGITVIEQEKVK